MRAIDFKEQLEKYVLSSIEPDDVVLSSDKERTNFFFEKFEEEYNNVHNKRMYPNIIDRVAEYLKGLPSSILLAYDDYTIAYTVEHWNGKTLSDKDKEHAVKYWFFDCASAIVGLRNKQERLTIFKKRLFDLLTEYNVSISFDCSGDTYGLSGEKIVVSDRKTGEIIAQSSGYMLDKEDLTED